MKREPCARGWTLAVALCMTFIVSTVRADEAPSDKPADEFSLNLHLIHPGADSSPGDPNAAFCLDGTYHLHYILRHPFKDRESVSFIHLTSPDMLHWTWETTKLQPAFTGHGMFSGTGSRLFPDRRHLLRHLRRD